MEHEQRELIEGFVGGAVSRRAFIRRAAAMGLAAPVVASLLATVPRAGSAQDAGKPQPSEPRPDGAPAPDDQQVLRLVTGAPFRMDPPTNTAGLWQLQIIVFQALTRVETDGTIVPGVADSWESNPELTSWTFKLNPNAKFSDGSPITADDVKWSWFWFCNPASKSVGYDAIAGTVVGFDAVRGGAVDDFEGIVVVDPQTITFNLSVPDPAFLAKTASYNTAVLKRDNVESGGEEWWRTPVTSGFFKVTEYTPGDQATMTLERNEFWWREPARLARIEIQLIADPQTQLVMYENNEIDLMDCPAAEFEHAVKPDGERHADLYWVTTQATYYFGFFVQKPPFDDVKVRQAFASAVDVPTLSTIVLGGLYPAQPRILPPGFPCGGLEQFQPAFDAAKAQQLLAESTYGGPDGLPKVTILVSEPAGSTAPGVWGRTAIAIQQQLQENLGVTVDVLRKVYGTLQEQQQEAQNLEGGVLFRLSFGVAVYDPGYIGNVALSTSSGNATGYNNPQVDELIKQAAVETDAETRCGLYTQIDKTISEEAIFLATFRGTAAAFAKPNVRGIKVISGSYLAGIHQTYITTEA